MKGVALCAFLVTAGLVNVGINAYELAGHAHHTLYTVGIAVWSGYALLNSFNLWCAVDEHRNPHPMTYAALAWKEFGDEKE